MKSTGVTRNIYHLFSPLFTGLLRKGMKNQMCAFSPTFLLCLFFILLLYLLILTLVDLPPFWWTVTPQSGYSHYCHWSSALLDGWECWGWFIYAVNCCLLWTGTILLIRTSMANAGQWKTWNGIIPLAWFQSITFTQLVSHSGRWLTAMWLLQGVKYISTRTTRSVTIFWFE